MQLETRNNKRVWPWLGLVAGVALVERALLAACYPVLVYHDTGAYRRLADTILNQWQGYDGTRTPGYPAFLALLGSNEAVYFTQLILGFLMTLLFFWMGWKLTGSPAFGALMGLAHTLNPGQLFFEANLMTETLATFWVVLAAAGVFAWLHVPGRRNWLVAVGIGLSAGLAGLTRPLYAVLPVWIALFLAAAPLFAPNAQSWRERLSRFSWKAALGVGIPGVLLVGAWVGYIYREFGVVSVSSMSGFNLIQHTGYYFEYVPDEYRVIRDIYIRYRDERIAQYGTQGNTIWLAIPEMSRESGMSFYQMSDVVGKLSVQLIREHPDLYLRYVIRGWAIYWKPPVYWKLANLQAAGLREPLAALIFGEQVLLFGANLFFILSSLVLLVWSRARRRVQLPGFIVFLGASLWVISIVQTLPDHGDNPRFLIPMQSLVVFWGVWLLARLVILWKEKHVEKMERAAA